MDSEGSSKRYGIALGRAFAGALLFSLPLQMTMEMWWLGFFISPIRLLVLFVAFIPLLVSLAYYSGFESGIDWRGAVIDAFVAITVGFVTSIVCLAIFAVISIQLSVSETLGKVLLQSIAGAFGATLAASQLGNSEDSTDDSQRNARWPYLREILLMVAGALFFGLNVAPTDEMTLIASQMSAVHGLLLMGLSLLCMHAFVYSVAFRGQEQRPEDRSMQSIFFRFTLVGYGISLLVSLFCLWCFERTVGMHLAQVVETGVVLGFPCTVGAASARLVL